MYGNIGYNILVAFVLVELVAQMVRASRPDMCRAASQVRVPGYSILFTKYRLTFTVWVPYLSISPSHTIDQSEHE